MTKRKRWLICIIVLAALLPASLVTARAEDREFQAITTHLKARYQAKRKRIPFLGLANFDAALGVEELGQKAFFIGRYMDNYNHRQSEICGQKR